MADFKPSTPRCRADGPRAVRAIRLSDSAWVALEMKAAEQGMTRTAYLEALTDQWLASASRDTQQRFFKRMAKS